MKFLVIDDEVIMVNTIVEILNQTYPKSSVYPFTDPIDALDTIKQQSIIPDIAFLDIEISGMNGLELAKSIKDISPQTKIIFVTGYLQYAVSAFKVRASGYLLKPVKAEELREEIENALQGLPTTPKTKIFVQTFGNFDVFVDGCPVSFSRAKSKEAFAYLIDRRGASATAAEIAAVLWEDKPYDRSLQKQMQSIIWYMMQSLRGAGIEHIVTKQYNSSSVNISEFECDYYELLKMDSKAVNSYMGEYMSQYSWAEMTVATLNNKLF